MVTCTFCIDTGKTETISLAICTFKLIYHMTMIIVDDGDSDNNNAADNHNREDVGSGGRFIYSNNKYRVFCNI